MYTNAQSMMAHKEEIQHQVMKRMNPVILALSETRLTHEIEDSEMNMPGYSIVRCDAENRNTGSVMIYVRNDMKYEVILEEKIISNCWYIAIEAKSRVYKGVVMVVYHSPSASHGDFIRFLEDYVELLVVKDQCIILGDFNIDLMTETYYSKKLITEMSSLGMKQYINKPTRITKDNQTMIDIVFANKKVNCKVYETPKITDHSWLNVELSIYTDGDKYREFIGRDYSKFHRDNFLEIIERNIDNRQDLNINERAEKLVKNIVTALDTVAPKKNLKIPRIWEGKNGFRMT